MALGVPYPVAGCIVKYSHVTKYWKQILAIDHIGIKYL